MLLSYTIVDLIFIIIMGLLICKYAPFWQEFSVKSLILRWPLRPVGLLLSNFNLFNFQYTLSFWECIYLCSFTYLLSVKGECLSYWCSIFTVFWCSASIIVDIWNTCSQACFQFYVLGYILIILSYFKD